MAFCGEFKRQGPALARNKPASHSCQCQNSVQGNLGMIALLCEHPPFAIRLQASQKPHTLVLVHYKIHLRSSKISTLNRNTWGPVTIQSCRSHRTFMGWVSEHFSALALLCRPDRSCVVQYIFYNIPGSDKTPRPWHKNIPKDYQVSGGPRSFSHKHWIQ